MILLAWTLSATVGFFAALYGVLDAQGDLNALRPEERNGRRMLALTSRRNHAIRAIIQFVWAILGVGLILNGIRDVPLTGVTGALIAGNLLLMLLTVLDVRDRVSLRHRLEEDEEWH